jgi:hypothetical protein
MGREALIDAEVGADPGQVKALLESRELILRGAIRRSFQKSTIEGATVDGSILRFVSDGEPVRLHLGETIAAAWAKAIATPPPSLRAKLGLEKGRKGLLIGACDDAALAEGLEGSLTTDAAQAAMLIARIDGPEDLAAAGKMLVRTFRSGRSTRRARNRSSAMLQSVRCYGAQAFKILLRRLRSTHSYPI